LVQLSATFSPFLFRDDLRLLCTLEDVSEKHQVAERLRLMQAAIEAAPSGIVIADVLGRIEWVNPAFTAMTGYTLEHIVGRSPSLLKSGRQGPRFYEQLWNTISRGQIWEGDLQNQRHDGAIYWEHMVIAPVVLPNGTIEHYVAIKQDISAQKEMESQVARTQRLESIGLLASGIAHDLNNVLAPILMAMDLFKLRYPDSADQARFDMVRKSAERGAGIVRQVLTFARGVDGERMSLRAEHLVKEVRNLLRETLPRNIELKLELAPDLPAVVGDPTQLHQVLLNLGVNARPGRTTRYSPSGSSTRTRW
jgi:PAS domain S-box-containing protein